MSVNKIKFTREESSGDDTMTHSYKLQPYLLIITSESISDFKTKIIDLAREFGFDPNQKEFSHENTEIKEVRAGRKPKRSKSVVSGDSEIGHGACDSGVASSPATSNASGAATDAETSRGEEAADKKESHKEESVKEFSKDDIVGLLQQVSAEKGFNAAKDLLSAFKAQRVSELNESDYPGFAVACIATLEQ